MVYHVLEVANTHAGSYDYLMDLIEAFAPFQGDFGMKLQVLHPDEIALPNYKWYPVYQELVFDAEQWRRIIEKVDATKDVWIDVFDAYSAQIIAENFASIYGIKFQASTLHNYELIALLSQQDWSSKKIIVNISGLDIEAIEHLKTNIQNTLRPGELILQIGFQNYPSQLSDSGFQKIEVLRQRFDHRISFAEHLAPDDEASIYAPILAAMMGAEVIEKHVRLKAETRYDHFSSMTVDQFSRYLQRAKAYAVAMQQPFINDNEKKYLETTLPLPVLKKSKSAGSLIHIDTDLHYKRTNAAGLHIEEVKQAQQDGFVLADDKKENTVLTKDDFRKARVGTIIACRLKSSRLKRKAVLPIGKLSATELCIKQCLKFEGVDETILATSTVDEDAELQQHTYAPEVQFFRGHPIDVMQRYLDVVNTFGIDILVRVTADMQYVSNEILQILLKSHLEVGADYTRAEKAADGTNLEIITATALRRAKELFPQAEYSEYMTYYFINNPSEFVINEVALPDELVRDYRLTLDYEQDLELFRKIEAHFEDMQEEYTIIDVFDFLDTHPEIAALNNHIGLIYKTDPSLVQKLKEVTTLSQ